MKSFSRSACYLKATTKNQAAGSYQLRHAWDMLLLTTNIRNRKSVFMQTCISEVETLSMKASNLTV